MLKIALSTILKINLTKITNNTSSKFIPNFELRGSTENQKEPTYELKSHSAFESDPSCLFITTHIL